MRMLFADRTVALIACLGIASVGCSPSPTADNTAGTTPPVATEDLDHMHHDHVHATTYPQAVAQIETLDAEIRAAFAAGKGADADEQVHEIGHALEDVTALATKAALPAEAQTEVDAAVETLLDAFGKIDEKLHGGDGADYQDVAGEISTALDTLKKHVGEAK
jgi:hypothetical protein